MPSPIQRHRYGAADSRRGVRHFVKATRRKSLAIGADREPSQPPLMGLDGAKRYPYSCQQLLNRTKGWGSDRKCPAGNLKVPR